ncbi:hypothetical protein HUJ04_004712 [Dendroctonus ponderosae]|nr:hypothetical protein HUJ04_004712 [Dendroctonus ponderosae]
MSETDVGSRKHKKSQRRDDLSNHLTCFFGVRRTTGCVATPTSIKRDGRVPLKQLPKLQNTNILET